MKKIQISEAEFEVMQVIWDNYPINTNQITQKLLASSNWSERTVQTMISRLEKKGVITHTKEGRLYVYSPLVKREDYVNERTDNFLNKFYKGTINNLVMNFIENNKLSEADIQELKEILEKK